MTGKKKAKKALGRPRKAEKKQAKVMKVGVGTYDRLKDLKGDLTFDELLEELLFAREKIRDAEKIFEVNGKLRRGIDLPSARGISVQEAIQAGTVPTLPKILLDLGYDDGFI